jgi:8-oxo-dGTP pyrophosphatase MutT (NUDIX family)
MAKQRISAGGIVVQEGKILLVHHYEASKADFWVMPGGGIEGNEGIFAAAERETWEETSLRVHAEKIAYFEDFIDGGRYVCKFWVVCRPESGTPSIVHAEPGEGYLTGARFFSQAELEDITVFPVILRGPFWHDLAAGFPAIQYLGYHQEDIDDLFAG